MVGLVRALAGARAARPLVRWVVAVLGYVVFRPPQEWVLLLIVGLGVALTLTVARIREGQGQGRQTVRRAWQLAARLTKTVADRIRGDQNTPTPLYAPHAAYGQVPPSQPVYGPVGGLAAYDPGALLSGIVAVLAAEGIPPMRLRRYLPSFSC